MKFILLLAGIVTAAPPKASGDVKKVSEENVYVTKDSYNSSFIKYNSEHEIVNLVLPVNSLNFRKHFSSRDMERPQLSLFFVEADLDADNRRVYKGLYVFDGYTVTKVLENGRDVAANMIDDKKVFFGAEDGIYLYKEATKEAVKYGTITDSIVAIARPNISDSIYILTENHEVYNVTHSGSVKTKVKEVLNAYQMVLDYGNNLYFLSDDKHPYVLTADGAKKIEGLPVKPSEVTLLKPPNNLDDGTIAIVDNVGYIIFPNGTSNPVGFVFDPRAKPTAFSLEGSLIHFYAYNKKIYEYNYLEIIIDKIFKELKSGGNKTNINLSFSLFISVLLLECTLLFLNM